MGGFCKSFPVLTEIQKWMLVNIFKDSLTENHSQNIGDIFYLLDKKSANRKISEKPQNLVQV